MVEIMIEITEQKKKLTLHSMKFDWLIRIPYNGFLQSQNTEICKQLENQYQSIFAHKAELAG